FRGNVSNNNITNTTFGMNITGKEQSNMGSLTANITSNKIPGIAMECPDVISLNLAGNTIGQLNITGYSILTNSYFVKDPSGTISVVGNAFSYPVTAVFKGNATRWASNTLNGSPYP
ncbi:MAG: hypothetical protein K8E24_008895, partial [Methanobacterium paludis]|nr:hypothetical protein [Methanobacterium paludis]